MTTAPQAHQITATLDAGPLNRWPGIAGKDEPRPGKRKPLLLTFAGCRYPVGNFAEASAVFQALRDRAGIGASGLRAADGDVTTRYGEIQARVSYNGRVWNHRQPDDLLLNAADRTSAIIPEPIRPPPGRYHA